MLKYVALVLIFLVAMCGSYSFTQKKIQAKKRLQVTKDTLMGVLLSTDPEVANVLVEMGMHCVGCPSHSHETLEMAAQVHNIPVDELVAKVNNYLDSKR